MGKTVLVAGASGALGRHVMAECRQRGYRVRALGRDAAKLAALGADETHAADALDPAALAGACKGAVAVFSCVGASVMLAPRYGRRGFRAVDVPANANLMAEARAAGVGRFVYVSTMGKDVLGRRLGYIDAHERVVDALAASGLDWAVVRPTGFFSALGQFVDMARKGPMPRFGDGSAKSNPIHDADLAVHCVDALEGGARERDVGGPEVFTRTELSELAFAAVGATPRYRSVPVGLARFGGLMLRPLFPRISHLIAFFATVSVTDLVAPRTGTRRLEDYFREVAAGRA